jgi:NAD(P)-dependent dehydrogenase (short-subunit alcohol dehydrogenase family)
MLHREGIVSMKTVVITGSTRGIGKGMAREFLKRGHNVVISGRTQEAALATAAELGPAAAAGPRAIAVACDVTDHAQVQALWDAAKAAFGTVDIWINNAGLSNTRFPIGRLPSDEVEQVPRTNLIGTMNGAQVALKGMRAQGQGAIYNFEGFGSNGFKSRGMSLYGCTKFAITYFTKALIAETKGGPVRVGYLSPGIVITDLSLRDKAKMPPQAWGFTVKIYNILADRVETVTPFLVERVLADRGHGTRIAWLTRGKSLRRFLSARLKPPGDRFPELRQAG